MKFMCTLVCLYVSMCVFSSVCMYISVSVSVHMSLCVCTRVYTCACESQMIISPYSSVTVTIFYLNEVFHSSRTCQVSCGIWSVNLRVLPVSIFQALGLQECVMTLSSLHGF